MKILWHSNAPWAKTGYGNQTDLFWWRIQKLGHQVVISANYGLAGSALNIENHGERTQVLPRGFTAHGNDVIASHARHIGADIVITLYDAWVFQNQVTSRFRWCPWLPVDHDPAPLPVVRALASAWQPIAYSRFGQSRLEKARPTSAAWDKAEYVPHGIDTKQFTPMDKQEAIEKLKFPEEVGHEFLAIMVAANKGSPSRKAFPQALQAWRDFCVDHPDALLYIHTHKGPEMQGLDMDELLDQLDIKRQNVIFSDPYWTMRGYPPDYMQTVYSAADVLLSPSMGEGFGLPIVEAQACGCPVIVGNWTSMPELCFAGWKVEGEPFYTPQAAWQYIPYIKGIRDALEQAFDAKGSKGLRKKARQGALKYDADAVALQYWKPVLERIAEEATAAPALETLESVLA